MFNKVESSGHVCCAALAHVTLWILKNALDGLSVEPLGFLQIAHEVENVPYSLVGLALVDGIISPPGHLDTLGL